MKDDLAAAHPTAWQGWLIVSGGMVLSVLLLLFARGSGTEPGDLVRLVITVVPTDATGLFCDSRVPIGGLRCTHAGGHPVVAGRDPPLRPFVTTNRELVLLSGVFESPDVEQWLRRARGSRERVTLRCRVEILPRPGRLGVRFGKRGPFVDEQPVVAGRVRDCRVKGPK